MSMVLVPVFIVLLIVNRLCMFLDHIFFPGFKKQKIERPVFIVAAPRSATTYLFHLLASQQEKFTAFRLWEIVFAPSILQKYFYSLLIKVDARIGNPLKQIILKVESKIFGKFIHIHKIGLTLPEEDEAILLWNLSTIYLNFFYPDTKHFDDYFLFDDCLPARKQRRIMKYYYRCVQRHSYIFNREGNKRFLSKNPAMMAKVKSLYSFFPDAIILNINRSPAKTIPSTISLNNSIYKFFTSIKPSGEINSKTRKILIDWYKMADRYINKFYRNAVVEIDFKLLVTGDENTTGMLCEKLDLEPRVFKQHSHEKEPTVAHISKNSYSVFEDSDLENVLEELPFLRRYSV